MSRLPPTWGVRRLRRLVALLVLIGCGAAARPTSESRPDAPSEPPVRVVPDAAPESPAPEKTRMWIEAGEHRFAITLDDTAAARAFAGLLPLTLEMSELNGNEKHASLPAALPTSASRPGTIRNGDLMLYGADTFVVFYSTFESSYAYTRIGRVDEPAGLARALGTGAVTVHLSDGP